MNWFVQLFTVSSVAQTVIIYALTIALGIWFGKIKIFGISLGVTWVLFIGLLFSYFGFVVNPETEHFLKEFGLILFVYTIGLQVGPGFFASLKKNALNNNIIAALTVALGVATTIILFYATKTHIGEMTGVMSGAVTNTPGLGAAQAAIKDLHINDGNTQNITLAYAVAYPFGVFGIILAFIILKKVLGVNIEDEKELHRKLNFIRSARPISIHLALDNKQLYGKHLRKVFELIKEPIVISRMYSSVTKEVITPTPDTILNEGDVLLIVAPKTMIEQLKIVVGAESKMNLKKNAGNLISRTIIVTQAAITHKRLGDIPELHQHEFTLTRLSRAGIEMVPHGNLFLQLGDTIKVVGTEEGVESIATTVGNSLKRLEMPDLAPIFLGIALGVVLGTVPFHFPNMPVPVKIGMAGGPLIVALILSRFGGAFYLNNYTTYSANLMIRELGISLFLASVGLESGHSLSSAFTSGAGYQWMWMGATITIIPLLIVGFLAAKVFRKTYFEICGLLAGASTDPPALAFALKTAGNDIPSASYATVYPLTMILRILAAQLLILIFS